jgi:hypothetical protein
VENNGFSFAYCSIRRKRCDLFAESFGYSGGGCGVMPKCAKVCEEYNVGRMQEGKRIGWMLRNIISMRKKAIIEEAYEDAS